MGVVIRKPTPIVVPVDLKRTIAKDRKEVAAIDDTWEAAASNIDHDYYMKLSAKPFLELEEKMEVKKYNLAAHYGVDLTKITPKFGLALKGKCVRTGSTNNFTLQLMNCFTAGVMKTPWNPVKLVVCISI